MKVQFGSWDGVPTIVIFGEDGEVEGLAWNETEKRWEPGFTEEALTKSTVMTPEDFSQAFPEASSSSW